MADLESPYLSSETLKDFLFRDSCLTALLKELVGSFSAYAIRLKGECARVLESTEGFAPFCAAVRAKDNGDACAQCDLEMGAKAAAQKDVLSYACHAGLRDIAAPVFVGSEHIATIFCGQRRFADPSEDADSRKRALELQQALGFADEELLNLWQDIKPATDDDIQQTARRLRIVSEYLGRSLERRQLFLQRLVGALDAVGNIRTGQQEGLQNLLDEIVVEASSWLGLSECALALREGVGDAWRISAALESGPASWREVSLKECADCCSVLTKLEDGEIVTDEEVLHLPFHRLPEPPKSRMVLIPLPQRPQPNGLLILGFEVPWSAVDIERRAMAKSLSMHAGLSLSNLLLEEQVSRMSDQRDALAAQSLQLAIAGPLAHEVRNGLQVISGAVERLDATIRTQGGPEGIKFLDRMKNESTRITSLVQSMLDLSKGKKSQKRWFFLNETVADAIALFKVLASRQFRGRNLRIETRLTPDLDRPSQCLPSAIDEYNRLPNHDSGRRRRPPLPGHPVCADPNHVKQVLVNLLQNAMKASGADRNLVVQISTALHEETSGGETREFVELRVVDHGCGFSPDLLPQLFVVGFSKFGGSGLGLNVVKTLVEKGHRGSVTAYSAGEGAGATFTVRLPVLADSEDPEEGANS